MNITSTLLFTYLVVTVSCIVCATNIYCQIDVDMGSEAEVGRIKKFILFYLLFVASNGVCAYANATYKGLLGTISTIINLVSMSACVLYWFLFIETKLESIIINRKRYIYIAAMPAIILCIIIITSPFTHAVFYYDNNGAFHRGPLYLAILIMSGIYLIYASIHISIKLRQMYSPAKKAQYRVLMLFLLFPITAGFIDLLIPHIPIMELTALLGIVTVFTSLQNSQIYVDSLTGLYNKQSADEYMKESLHYVSESNPLYFFMLDADNFKMINDKYGHSEGDRALQIIASVLNDYAKAYDDYVARWGGDEFVLIAEIASNDTPDSILEEINSRLKIKVREEGLEYPISLSGGYSKCVNKKADLERIFNEADYMLYTKKSK